MIKHKILALFVLTALMFSLGAWTAMLPALQPAAQPTTDICIGRWVWNTTSDPPNGYWEPPFPENLLGALDLRSTAQRGSPGPIAQGVGVFTYDISMVGSGLLCPIAGELDTPMSLTTVNTIASALGLRAGEIAANTMRGILIESYLEHGDPAGETAWKPLRISRNHGVKLYLGGYGAILDEKFSQDSPAFQNTLDVRWADYRRLRESGTSLELLRRWTGYDGLKLFGRAPTAADLDKLLPPEYRQDGTLSPKTTVTDDFDRADEALEASANWTQQENGNGGSRIGIVTNAIQATHIEGFVRTLQHSYSYGTTLSGTDQYGQYVWISHAQTFQPNTLYNALRWDVSGLTFYEGGWRRDNANAQHLTIVDSAAGVRTQLATTAESRTANDVVKFEVDGSTLRILVNDTEALTFTDTGITAGNSVGLSSVSGDATFVNIVTVDDWEAADLGAAPAARRVIRIN